MQAFLDGLIGFLDIPEVIETTMTHHTSVSLKDVAVALEADRWAREFATAAAKEHTLSKVT